MFLNKIASFLLLIIVVNLQQTAIAQEIIYRKAIIRGDTTQGQMAIVFTGDLYGDGGDIIFNTLKQNKIKASFFFTGNFYRNPSLRSLIKKLKVDGHYLGAHSDKHLLYCDWTNRDSLLVTKQEFQNDLLANYEAMRQYKITKKDARYFLPPYEWYNDSIAMWTNELDLTLINFSPGTLSHADYTTPAMKNYRSSDTIFQSIKQFDTTHGLNGFILLLHIGTDADRIDKFYYKLDELIGYLKRRSYRLVKINELLNHK